MLNTAREAVIKQVTSEPATLINFLKPPTQFRDSEFDDNDAEDEEEKKNDINQVHDCDL